MTCSCNYLLFFVWLLIVKTDKYLLVLWSCNYYSLNTIVSWLVNWKIIEFYITETTINRKNCNHFPKSRCIPELSWNFLKSQMPRSCFFSLWISRCVSSEQPFLNTTGLHDDLLLLPSLFHFFYFIFSAPISFSLYFPIAPSLFLCSFARLYQA